MSESSSVPEAREPQDDTAVARPPNFELRNAGAGPDPLTLDRIASEVDFAIFLLLRDYHCPKCRAQ
ncbi:MAG: hypothetical protein V5A24_07915, partial [Haloarculaceae archaeon]